MAMRERGAPPDTGGTTCAPRDVADLAAGPALSQLRDCHGQPCPIRMWRFLRWGIGGRPDNLLHLDLASLKRRVPAAHQAHTSTYTHTPGLRLAACRAVFRLFDPQLLELLQLFQRFQLPKLLLLL